MEAAAETQKVRGVREKIIVVVIFKSIYIQEENADAALLTFSTNETVQVSGICDLNNQYVNRENKDNHNRNDSLLYVLLLCDPKQDFKYSKY